MPLGSKHTPERAEARRLVERRFGGKRFRCDALMSWVRADGLDPWHTYHAFLELKAEGKIVRVSGHRRSTVYEWKEQVMADKKSSQEEEPKEKMYRFKIDVDIPAETIDAAREKALNWLIEIAKAKDAKKTVQDKVTRVVRAKYSSRADRLSEAMSKVSDAVSTVEELKGECEEWYNNLPENFQNGEKGEMLQTAISALEDLQSELENASSNGENVEFPGMFG